MVLIFQDKTFGLKNKKGTKQQKFIAKVNNQVQQTTHKKVNGHLPLSFFKLNA